MDIETAHVSPIWSNSYLRFGDILPHFACLKMPITCLGSLDPRFKGIKLQSKSILPLIPENSFIMWSRHFSQPFKQRSLFRPYSISAIMEPAQNLKARRRQDYRYHLDYRTRWSVLIRIQDRTHGFKNILIKEHDSLIIDEKVR